MSKKCIKMLRDDYGLSPDEAKVMVRDLDAAAARNPKVGNISVLLKRTAKEQAVQLREKANRRRRNARRQAITDSAILSDIAAAPNIWTRIAQIVAGDNKYRYSIDMQQRMVRNDMTRGFTSELEIEIPGIFSMSRNKAFRADIWREMYAGGERSVTGNEDAFKFARIAEKWKEVVRVRANNAGAAIANLPGHVVMQTHNARKIIMSEAQWKKDMMGADGNNGWLDPERTFGMSDPKDFLDNVYTNITTGTRAEGAGHQGTASLGERLGRERVLHFKDAEAAMAYAEKYGNSDVVAGILEGIAKLSEDIALMERFGPNPDATFSKIMSTFERDIAKQGGADRKLFGKRRGLLNLGDPMQSLKNRYAQVSRAASIPVSPSAAHWAQGLRNLIHTTKMGQVVISAFPDMSARASVAQTNGMGLLTPYADLLKQFASGPMTPEMKKVLRGISVAMDGMLNTIHSRIGGSGDVPGAMSKAANLMFKVNLLSPWTDFMDRGIGFLLSHNLADNAGKNFDGLHPMLRETLEMYDIRASDWDDLRKAVIIADDRSFITTESIREHPDIKNKEALVKKLGTYFVGETDIAVPKPGARERAIVFGSTRPGTGWGEAARFMAQYKMFSVTMISKVMPNAMRARVPGFIHLAVMSTILGYTAASVKDLLRGKTPLDPGTLKAWERGMLQGGGMGILGDVLLNDFNEYGRGLGDVIAGPAGGAVGDVFKVIGGFARLDDKSALAFRTLVGNTPFINLFYTRQAVDYLFTYHVQEMLDPGYLRRYERRVESDNNQTFFLPPSSVIGRGGGF